MVMGMGSELYDALLEIEPRELSFQFELKKQSACSVHLVNNTNSYVAFKVKTTSPKRYCVRPNTGVILPRSTCDFTVTMQAMRVAPPDMQLKDKFLIQSTVVPYGTTDEDIVPSIFSKEGGKHIEESKLRVVLVCPPDSPVLQPIHGSVKQEPDLDTLILKENPVSNNQEQHLAENFQASQVSKDVDDLKLKLNNLDMKLTEAERTITGLREEKNAIIQERDKLKSEIEFLTRKCNARVRAGFPFLFVVFIAIIGLMVGYQLQTQKSH